MKLKKRRGTMPKVSIIVPIYNVEKYIRQCIDSLINQTLQDIEIILVDDGSPDNCGSIIDEYASNDDRIKVIHQVNIGLGMARNSGLSLASGEYIGFVDSDDWVELSSFENLYKQAIKVDSDIIKGHVIVKRNVISNGCKTDLESIESQLYEKNEIKENLLSSIIGPKYASMVMTLFDVSVCSNIYKRSFINKYNLQFKSERKYYGEDFLFNLEAFHKARKILQTNICFYHYRCNPISLTTSYRPTMNSSVLKLYKHVHNYINENNLGEEYHKRNKMRLCNLTFNMIFNICKASNTMTIQQKINSIHEIIDIVNELEAFEDFNVNIVPIKWRIIFRNIKARKAIPLYFICTIRQLIINCRRIILKGSN
jgi:glycosyltransferase involved in cell wall biosynthesis